MSESAAMRRDSTDDALPAEEPAAQSDGAKTPVEEPENLFQVGDEVIVRPTFHSQYFRNLAGVIQEEASESGTAETLWTVKIDVPPYRLYAAEKHLQLQSEARAKARSGTDAEDKSAAGDKGSFFTRFIPWKR